MSGYTVSEDFISNLILQRTGPFIKLGGGAALRQWMETGDTKILFPYLLDRNLTEDYFSMVFAEIALEVEQLSERIEGASLDSIVSIGPGNGLVELALMSIGETRRALLVDIESNGSHHHNYAEKGSGYCQLIETMAFLRANGISETDIQFCNPLKHPLRDFDFTFCISLLSMGFHYPCEEYAQFILRNMLPGGYLIFDKRKSRSDDGFDHISSELILVDCISSEKSERLFFRKSN